MCVLDGGGDRQRGRGSFRVHLGRPTVTNGDFAAVVRERSALPKLLWGGLVHNVVTKINLSITIRIFCSCLT